MAVYLSRSCVGELIHFVCLSMSSASKKTTMAGFNEASVHLTNQSEKEIQNSARTQPTTCMRQGPVVRPESLWCLAPARANQRNRTRFEHTEAASR